MCGLTGFVDPAGRTGADAGADLARRMAERLAHRGPDDAGVCGRIGRLLTPSGL
jgi:asparagine synthetase B (glutamine-hydrolysing)